MQNPRLSAKTISIGLTFFPFQVVRWQAVDE
jgi:hypothetical protein